MAKVAAAPAEVRRRPRTGYLATPLSVEEQRYVARMYRQHQGLIRLLGRKMCRKYFYVSSDDLYSCINTGFIKTCRAWRPEKGTFSTLLTIFCEGDIMHWIRDHNWLVKAPGKVRGMGQTARRLLEQGLSTAQIMAQLGVSEAQLKLALVATEPIDHDVFDFEHHVCPRATPMELLEDV